MNRHKISWSIATIACLLTIFTAPAGAENPAGPDFDAMARDMMALNAEKQYQSVIDVYEKYAGSENQNGRFYRELGDACLRNEVRLSRVKAKGEWDTAEKYLLKAHMLEPEDLYVIMNLAVLYTWKSDNYNAQRFAAMYLEKGGKDRAQQAETILQKYKYQIIPEGFDNRGKGSK
jgi:Flp pilus assembly protein TadD